MVTRPGSHSAIPTADEIPNWMSAMEKAKTLCDTNEIVQFMRSGDLEALDRITRCFGDRLIAVGRRYCRNAEEAKDAVQDALLAAGEHLQDFRGDGSVEGWLVRMVANACHRMRRGRKNDPSMHIDITETSLPSQPMATEDLTRRGEISQALGDALLKLEPEDRAILLLSEGEGWTSPEIAEEFDLTPNAIRTRLSRMRARLRPQLEHLLG